MTQTQQSSIVDELGMGKLEIWQLSTSEDFLRTLFQDLFVNHWHEIQYGILVQGGVLEFEPPCAPTKFGYLDGYITVEFGKYGHMHLCVGWNKGVGCCPTPPHAAELRLPSRVELYRKLNNQDQPTFWGLRAFNSRKPDAEQTLHIYLPNPLLTKEMQFAPIPDWNRLALWDYLRKTYLAKTYQGIEQPDAKDRLATRFAHD
jgi:hypothetical protein